ncbi:MAG: NAD(P)-dependent oxidoreductase [Saprospiraceae bacterium]
MEAVSTVDAIIIRSDIIDTEVLNNAKNLKIVVRAGAGYDNVDLGYASEKGVVVMNTPGQNSNAVAELVMGFMVYMSRNKFDGTSGSELKGKKIGLHAFGYVSKNVARIAKGFGMEVYAFDPFVNSEEFDKYGVKEIENVEELYNICNFISLHIPATEKTKKSINFELLNKLPQNACLINTARKEVIDEEGLLQLMESRPDIKYVSDIKPDLADVFMEKYSKRVFFTPKKSGAQTAEANINAGLAAATQIVEFFKNGDVKYKVN